MTYKKTKLSQAMSLVAKWHEYQIDKGGLAYVAHLMGVWQRVRQESEDIQCVALLHDILEDTECPVEEIDQFGPVVFEAVIAMTHKPQQNYEDYIQQVKKNRIARTVKLADLADNMSEFRSVRLNDHDKAYFAARIETRYKPAVQELLS